MATATGNGSSNGHAHAEDITITRRLYRSGESEYLIDGKSARLRDIQDLFSGTGLGPESYAIIEQGRIGQILSNKPADRRAIIEEAAGIGKYKTRKRLAEAKLESAKQNLSRVFDILEEVGRQVNSLKRQASKAKRYEELRTEMLAHLRQAVSGRFRMLEREAAKLALDLSQAQGLFNETSAQLQEQEAEHTRVQESCYRTEAELTAARARVAELNLESERTRGRLELQAKQIGAIDERLSAGETETQDLETRRQQRTSRAGRSRGHRSRRSRPRARRCANCCKPRPPSATRCRTICASASAASKDRRIRVLQLLGEASTLRNQVVADRRISGGDRARFGARPQGRRDGIGRSGASGAGENRAVRQALRAANGTGIAGRPAPACRREAESAASRSGRIAAHSGRTARQRFRGSNARRIRSKKFFRIAPTPPNPSSACSPPSNMGRWRASSPPACWRISSK